MYKLTDFGYAKSYDKSSVCTSLVGTVQYVVSMCMYTLVPRLLPNFVVAESLPGNEAVHLPAFLVSHCLVCVCPFVCLSVHPSACLSIRLPVCLLSSLQAPEVLKDKKYHSSVSNLVRGTVKDRGGRMREVVSDPGLSFCSQYPLMLQCTSV